MLSLLGGGLAYFSGASVFAETEDQINDEPEELKENPQLILQRPHRYRHLENFEALLEQKARWLAKNSPRYALEFSHVYQEKSYYEEVLEIAARSAGNDHPWVAIYFASHYAHRSYTESVLKQAAKQEPRFAFFLFPRYKNVLPPQNILSILLVATKMNSNRGFRWAIDQKKNPYAKKIMSALTQINPQLIVDNFATVKKCFPGDAGHLLSECQKHLEMAKAKVKK